MDLGLRDKVAVIRGGSVGIGLAVAKALAAEGVHIVMAARNAERLEKARIEVASVAESRAVAVACDVATPAGVAAAIATAETEFGGADILINNAGTGSNETIMNAADDKWQYIIGICTSWQPYASRAGSFPQCAGAAAASFSTTPRSAPHSRSGTSRSTT